MLGPWSHEDKQYQIVFTLIFHAVLFPRPRDDSIPGSTLAFFSRDVEHPPPLNHIVDFVRFGVAVNSLVLSRLQAIQVTEVLLGSEKRYFLHLVPGKSGQGAGVLESTIVDRDILEIIWGVLWVSHGAYCSG